MSFGGFVRVVLVILLWGLQSWALTNSVPAESSDFESSVFYSSVQYDSDLKETMNGYCNGNLISSRVMITAAHCVFMAEVLAQRDIEVQIGEYKWVTTSAGEKRKVGYVTTSKQRIRANIFFTSAVSGRLRSQGLKLNIGPEEDLAVVVFDRPLSLKETFHFLPIISQKEWTSLRAHIVDFMPTVVTINPFEEITTTDVKRQGLLDQIHLSGGSIESKSRVRVSPGDSGSPLFVLMGGQWKQLAVVKGRADTIFSNWDIFGILDQKMCDIAGHIDEAEVRSKLCF